MSAYGIISEVLVPPVLPVEGIRDAVMAFWNAPNPQADHCERACRAALQAKAANQAINLEFEAEGLQPFHTRFGIHVGDAVVGNLGSSERMNYTVLGNVVNLAARLEGLNKQYGTQILVSDSVYARIRHRFRCRFVDTVVAKGMAAETRVYELSLRDAAKYMTSLPRDEQNAEHWRPAATLLGIIGEKGGCTFFAERAVAFGLRKGVNDPPPEPDLSKKTSDWGKRKLKRDE